MTRAELAKWRRRPALYAHLRATDYVHGHIDNPTLGRISTRHADSVCGQNLPDVCLASTLHAITCPGCLDEVTEASWYPARDSVSGRTDVAR